LNSRTQSVYLYHVPASVHPHPQSRSPRWPRGGGRGGIADKGLVPNHSLDLDLVQTEGMRAVRPSTTPGDQGGQDPENGSAWPKKLNKVSETREKSNTGLTDLVLGGWSVLDGAVGGADRRSFALAGPAVLCSPLPSPIRGCCRLLFAVCCLLFACSFHYCVCIRHTMQGHLDLMSVLCVFSCVAIHALSSKTKMCTAWTGLHGIKVRRCCFPMHLTT
jgi:hypothetical protein